MPELPEVETVARQLEPFILRKRLSKVKVFDRKLSSKQLSLIMGMRVERVFRCGKQVVFSLHRHQQELFVAIHLRMTGRLLWSPSNQPTPEAHLRACFYFQHGSIAFVDPRRFGTIRICRNLEEVTPPAIDPLTPAFTILALQELLEKSKQPLKTWLLRQDRLVGIGNIYATEILHRAHLHPERNGQSLDTLEIKSLYQNTRKVLLSAIDCAGTTFSNFSGVDGDSGAFQRFLRVYDRAGLPCRRCKAPISRLVQAGRSTFYCPTCQH